jgi:NAD(P)-dependent dehydrogenase (short-subunit alcohol dehydrogenase family)
MVLYRNGKRGGDMQGSARPIVLVTGSTDGIGLETARELARRGARLIVHGRRTERIEAAVAAVRAVATDAVAGTVQADLSALDDVRQLARRLAELPPAHVLLNNAGVFERQRAVSIDGFERTLAINHLVPFLLSHLLLADRGGAGRALERIVNVSSVAHNRGQLALEDLHFERRRFDGYSAYAASKLANVLFTLELAQRLHAAGRAVTTNALHPGVVSTKLLTEGFQMRGPDSLAEGAATLVMLALEPQFGPAAASPSTGGYYANRRPAAINPGTRDARLQRDFYDRSLELTGAPPLA